MFTLELRTRLELLNRQPLAQEPASAIGRLSQILSRLVEELAHGGAALHAAPQHEPKVPSALATGIEIENAAGRCLQIDRPLADIWPDGRLRNDGLGSDAIEEVPGEPGREELAALSRHFPGDTLFLDLETCGLSGSMVFLVGLVCQLDGQLVVRQLLARTYAEERAMLAALWPLVAARGVLCTFNGKTFDWPMVHDRSTLHRLGSPPRSLRPPRRDELEPTMGAESAREVGDASILGPRDLRPRPVHCDLLHHARRRWRGRLPNCRLQTLETFVCRRRRSGDIPGSEVPVAYHHFVRSGEPRRMEAILHHNALDLVTLVQLADRLLGKDSLDRDPAMQRAL